MHTEMIYPHQHSVTLHTFFSLTCFWLVWSSSFTGIGATTPLQSQYALPVEKIYVVLKNVSFI